MGTRANEGTPDLEALARQYWDAWTDAARGPAAATHASGLGEAVRWWSAMARQTSANADAQAAVGRFDTQARAWMAQMEQLAGQFAGRPGSAADIAQAWQRMLGGQGDPFATLMAQMQGPQSQGFDAWMAQVRPFLGGMMPGMNPFAQAGFGAAPFANAMGTAMSGFGAGMGDWSGAARDALGTPAFGFAREHQERWQALARAHIEYQERAQAHQALMSEATQDAIKRFEAKLAEREAPGREIQSARALFDVWIDAAEEAYADIALSPRFRETYGAMVNAQMRLRSAIEGEIEQVSALFGMPTRSELDATHRKVTQLERELRRLRDAQADAVREPRAPMSASTSDASRAQAAAAAKPAAKPAPAKAAAAPPKPIRARLVQPQAKRAPDAKSAKASPGKASTKSKAAREVAARPSRRIGAQVAGTTASKRGTAAPAPRATSAWVQAHLKGTR